MTKRVCVVESQVTGQECSFTYGDADEWAREMRAFLEHDVKSWATYDGPPLPGEDASPDEIEDFARGNVNWMSGPIPQEV